MSTGRLRYDHRSFGSRFADLRARAATHGWLPLLGSWTGFTADVVRHFEFEELSVFPGFVRHCRDGAVIRTLLDQHEELRELLEALSGAVAGERVDGRELDRFMIAMEEHELLEAARIDPWLEQQERRHGPGAR